MIEQVKVPILIIHGTDDMIVPFNHSKELHRKCPNPLPPLWVKDGGHEDIYTYECYMKRLKRMFEHELNS